MPRPTLTDFNPKFHAEILKQLPKTKAEMPVVKRLRQRTDKRSALEDRFGCHLRANITRDCEIEEQSPLRIGNGSNYYLDFHVIRKLESGGYEHFGYEVKGGFARTAGIVKLKSAATQHKWIEIYLTSWINGEWVYEQILQ